MIEYARYDMDLAVKQMATVRKDYWLIVIKKQLKNKFTLVQDVNLGINSRIMFF